MTGFPPVSVVLATLNEERFLPRLLDQLDRQTYLGPITVLIADGGSTDRTVQLAMEYPTEHIKIEVIDNPDRVPAAGFNRAFAMVNDDATVLLGGHMQLPPDYIEQAVGLLRSTHAACAGGVIDTVGEGRTGAAIAAAMSSPFGVGHARFRVGSDERGPVDTVAFGAYDTQRVLDVGGFDVALVGAEDDELNLRLRLAGGQIWLDPAIRSTYYCRDSLAGLYRQYFGYGHGKFRVLRKHRRVPSLRALVPSAFVLGVGAAAVAVPVVGPVPLAAVGGSYVSASGASALLATGSPARVPRTMAAFAVMHAAYGLGFLSGLLPRRRR